MKDSEFFLFWKCEFVRFGAEVVPSKNRREQGGEGGWLSVRTLDLGLGQDLTVGWSPTSTAVDFLSPPLSPPFLHVLARSLSLSLKIKEETF